VSLTSANYNTTGVAVTLTGVEDANETSEIAVITASAGGVTPFVQNITTVENDTRPMFSGATSVMEGNAGVMFVKLSGDPGTSRTVTLSSSLPAITLNPMLLSFDSSNWNNMQAVTVTGAVDANVISEVVTITGTGLITNTTIITAVDTNTMGIQISGNTTVAEAGTSTINVRLSQDPSTPLTVSLASNTPASVTVSPATLTFNSCNGAGCWDTTQTVTLTGIHDGNATTEPVTITATAGAISTTWNVNTQDDDAVAVFASPTTPAFTVIEETVGAITVKLSGDPGTTREMTITSSDPTKISVITNTLSFNSSNWNIPQAVTLSALADMNVIDETVTITASGVGLGTSIQTVTSKDNDTLALLVTNVSGTTSVNEGSSLQFNVKLNFQPPSSPYTVTISSPQTSPAVPGYVNNPTYVIDPANSGVGSTTLSFTTGDYSTDKAVTINAPENYYIDDKTTTLSFSGLGATTQVFNITVKDNDPIEHMVVDGGMGGPCSEVSTGFNGSNLVIGASCSIGASYDKIKSILCNGSITNCNERPDDYSYGGEWGTGNGNAKSISVIEDFYALTNRFSIVSTNSVKGRLNYFGNGWSDGSSLINPTNVANDTGLYPNAVYDSINKKVIVMTYSHIFTAVNGYPQTYIINPYSAGKIQLDTINNKFIGVYLSHEIFKCNLDLTGCSTNLNLGTLVNGNPVYISNGLQTDYDFVVDPTSNKIIVAVASSVSANGANSNVPELFICDIALTSCIRKTLNSNNYTAYINDLQTMYYNTAASSKMRVVVDPYNHKILTFVYDPSQNYSTILYRCNMDGTGCTSRNLTGWLTINVGSSMARPFIDTVNKKVRIVTINKGMGGILSMFSMLLYID
jgi:hypothetical protein